MATTNLGLESIELTDRISTDFVRKLNDNMSKLDTAYGTLKEGLLGVTGKETIVEAINSFNEINTELSELTTELNTLKSKGSATASQIFNGITAIIQGEEITGTALSETTTAVDTNITNGYTAYDNQGNLITGSANKPIPTINVELTGSNATYVGYISGYGAGIDNNGTLVIWAMSNTTNYENISFINTSIGAGTIGEGWNINTGWDTANAVSIPHACTITGLQDFSTINVTLEVAGVDATDDYVEINVTVTAE